MQREDIPSELRKLEQLKHVPSAEITTTNKLTTKYQTL